MVLRETLDSELSGALELSIERGQVWKCGVVGGGLVRGGSGHCSQCRLGGKGRASDVAVGGDGVKQWVDRCWCR